MPDILIIGGPNGAGKTTFAKTTLTRYLDIDTFVNADAIASALSPYHPEEVSLQAGKIMLQRLEELRQQKRPIALESTLASRSLMGFLEAARASGYHLEMIYLTLPSADFAIQRVAQRVAMGGHNIPVATIRRRFGRSLYNMVNLYLPFVDEAQIYSNAGLQPSLLSHKEEHRQAPIIHEPDAWKELIAHAQPL